MSAPLEPFFVRLKIAPPRGDTPRRGGFLRCSLQPAHRGEEEEEQAPDERDGGGVLEGEGGGGGERSAAGGADRSPELFVLEGHANGRKHAAEATKLQRGSSGALSERRGDWRRRPQQLVCTAQERPRGMRRTRQVHRMGDDSDRHRE